MLLYYLFAEMSNVSKQEELLRGDEEEDSDTCFLVSSTLTL